MTTVNQKEYLKKYLSIGGNAGKKKKKRKDKPIANASRLKIIDDDDNIHIFNKAVEEDMSGATEDAPQIVGVIDDRPLELRIDDYRKSDLWKPLGLQNDDHSNLQSEVVIKQEKVNRDPESSDGNSPKLSSKTYTSNHKRKSRNYDVDKNEQDASPKRKARKYSRSQSPEDQSPKRNSRYDDDRSPPRRRRRSRSNDLFLPRVKTEMRQSSKRQNNTSNRHKKSPHRKDRPNSAELSSPRIKSESSPKRRSPAHNSVRNPSRERYRGNTTDLSPPRVRSERNTILKRKSRWHDNNESQLQRKNKTHSLPPLILKAETHTNSIRDNKMTITISGKKAGLQGAQELVVENEMFKKREDELFEKMHPEVSGVGAKTIMRDRKTGKIRDLKNEANDHKKKQAEDAERSEKFSRWGKGLKQVEDYNKKLSEDLHEMNKPLARYANDEDLEKYLKEKELEGDPMLAFIRKKKRKELIESNKPLKPQYEGEFMPNRYGIRPGHRWDGVDRSNGYEIKWFQVVNAQAAQEEDIYKWSTEDM